MSDSEHTHFDRLDQRRRWLTERIAAKSKIGWDIEYDTSERDALAWALDLMTEQVGQQP
jgi:hypothetical protein